MDNNTSNIVFVGFISWGTRNSKEYSNKFNAKNENRLRRAFLDLLEKDFYSSYVILEEKTSGRLIQFAGSKKGKVFLNFPAKDLSEREFEIAVAILKEYGIFYEEETLFLDEDGSKSAGKLASFSKNLGDDVDLILEVCSKIFFVIYGFEKDLDLQIREG